MKKIRVAANDEVKILQETQLLEVNCLLIEKKAAAVFALAYQKFFSNRYNYTNWRQTNSTIINRIILTDWQS